MARIKRVTKVPQSDLLTRQQAVDKLGLSANRVRWLIINGHLQRGVTADGQAGGVTRASVELESTWRSGATQLQRLRRVLGYAFTWMP